ncbi:MAG: hypothetical protein ACK55I_27165, partial [bacterium]
HNSVAKAGSKAMPKKPPDTSTAANGALTRASQLTERDNSAASINICRTNDRITSAPACACPARKSVVWSGVSSSPPARPWTPAVTTDSTVRPP